MSLGPQADAARLGVAAGQGIAVPFTTISVSDGVSMNHKGMRMSLVSRELIADFDRSGGARPLPTTRWSASPAATRRCPA